VILWSGARAVRLACKGESDRAGNLRHHRQEVKARAQAVVVVTTLFLHFLAAVAQPVLWMDAIEYAILIFFRVRRHLHDSNSQRFI